MDEINATILVVDDEEPIRNAVSRKLQAEGFNCVIAVDGKEALWKVFMQDFNLVLLDIKMPGMSGMDVLARMVVDHPDTGVVMITAIGDSQTAVEAMKLGAYDYVSKPFNLDDLVIRVGRALERRRLVLENRDYQVRLEQKIERQTGQIDKYVHEAVDALSREEMAVRAQSESGFGGDTGAVEEMYLQTARVLAQMNEIHEPYSLGHAERVSVLANQIALKLGCPEKLIKDIRLAAVVQDIGKITIPDSILFKPGGLTSAEYSEVKKHPMATVEMVRHVDRFQTILPLIESHHEWFNGKGYPHELKGECIPIGARILSVADSYVAMTCPRPYRLRLSEEEAIQALKKGTASQWDPTVIDVLLQILEQDAERLATVLRQT